MSEETNSNLSGSGNALDTPIEALLPHRSPFLFVEKLTRADDEGTEGYYTFGPDTWFFKGHFPEYPVVPGVILVETMAQCGGAGLVATGKVQEGGLFLLTGVDNAKFRSQVRPGDTVRLVMTNIKITRRVAKLHGECYVDDKLACEADVSCILASKPAEGETAR